MPEGNTMKLKQFWSKFGVQKPAVNSASNYPNAWETRWVTEENYSSCDIKVAPEDPHIRPETTTIYSGVENIPRPLFQADKNAY